MQQTTSRAEAERLLGIAEKLLQGKDLNGSKDFAVLAQETEPLLDGSDQILSVVDVLIAAEKRINNKHHDWYAILQLDRRYDDLELIKRQYRRLALLLHPDKNKFPFADHAFKLVADAWAVLSDSSKKAVYDNELFMFEKVNLVPMKKHRENQQQQQQEKLPVRKAAPPAKTANLWTACPYCYNLYEYLRTYEGCCLRCQNCERAFQAVEIPALPPTLPGKDAYYCCWAFFPMGFAMSNSDGAKNNQTMPNWMPPMFPTMGTAWPSAANIPNCGGSPAGDREGFSDIPPPPQQPRPQSRPLRNATPVAGTGQKKRGRPRKNPF